MKLDWGYTIAIIFIGIIFIIIVLTSYEDAMEHESRIKYCNSIGYNNYEYIRIRDGVWTCIERLPDVELIFTDEVLKNGI